LDNFFCFSFVIDSVVRAASAVLAVLGSLASVFTNQLISSQKLLQKMEPVTSALHIRQVQLIRIKHSFRTYDNEAIEAS
jgi:ABC-type transporter Mla subunit MlaD